MKTNSENALQFANSIMPFIKIGVQSSALEEVRDSIKTSVEKLINDAGQVNTQMFDLLSDMVRCHERIEILRFGKPGSTSAELDQQIAELEHQKKCLKENLERAKAVVTKAPPSKPIE